MKQKFNQPKSKVWYNHYSNPDSQGALLCETACFPDSFDDETHECYDAYTDRIQSWDYENYKKACKVLNGTSLKNATDDQIKEYAHIALKTPVKPERVRIVHYFNVSTGYPCLLVIAVFKKK